MAHGPVCSDAKGTPSLRAPGGLCCFRPGDHSAPPGMATPCVREAPCSRTGFQQRHQSGCPGAGFPGVDHRTVINMEETADETPGLVQKEHLAVKG